jgi:uncharacterized protein YutE (UPF0331/DUF86 family)
LHAAQGIPQIDTEIAEKGHFWMETRKLAEVDQSLLQVKEYAGISVEEYESSWKTQRIIERTLQMMVETCVDVAGHIISDSGFRTPTSYSDTFKILYENGVLPAELFAKMEKMAKFRNIIVHHYDSIDAEIVAGILKRDLDDFGVFQTTIVSLLEQEEDEKSPENPVDPTD